MKALTQRDWLQVGDAASLLGVSEKTLRNWDGAGKLRPVRHPINGYRLYKTSDIHRLKRELSSAFGVQQVLDFSSANVPITSAPKPKALLSKQEMHWRAEVALDPKHRPQLWDKPSSTVRRDWRKFPQEAHVLDRECRHYRRLTAKEIAVLQGFDPKIVEQTNFSQRQSIGAIGNAVPPPMAKAVFQALARSKTWQNKTSIEICAGIGGLAIGASSAGFEHLLCLDIDPVCFEFLKKLPELRSTEISSEDLRYADLKRFRGSVGILSGGPPCQPWSASGLRLGSEDDRDVLADMPALIEAVEPEAFLFENVAGLTTGQNKKYFEALMKRLQTPSKILRYGVLAAKFNAADFGVPQIRERVFILGFRDTPASEVYKCFDDISLARSHRDPAVSDSSRREWVSLGSAIEKLEDPGGWREWIGNSSAFDLDEAE